MWGGEGLYGRPRPVHLASILGEHDPTSTQGDHKGPPISINLSPSPSPSVGAGVDEDEGLGRLRRPRPVHLTHILRKHDHLPTPRATIKAHPTPHRPPSPLHLIYCRHSGGTCELCRFEDGARHTYRFDAHRTEPAEA